MKTRRKLLDSFNQAHFSLLYQIDPKSFNEAREDKNWVKAMNIELDQIEKKNTWDIVPRPKDKNIILNQVGVQEQAR